MRPSDILARHGGDEFVLLLPCTGPAGAQAALERLRSDDDPVSWSIGISEWRSGEALDAPLARADKHLYEAKLAAGEAHVEAMRGSPTACRCCCARGSAESGAQPEEVR